METGGYVVLVIVAAYVVFLLACFYVAWSVNRG